ncbi:response regulator [Sphingomonas aracearum]|uniref:response regulator n=1 Tax=Sphingomonas aracearum TaxID=2283317 RepID=UPI001EF095C3|nr:response regulator [Sphingomonas aracearum]
MLIIEDDALIALDLQGMLEAAGALSFSFADSEAEAIAEARARRPDVIASDVMLREGSGPGAVQAIHAEYGPLPVFYVTGTPEACQPCEPPVHIVPKPATQEAIRAAFTQVRGGC